MKEFLTFRKMITPIVVQIIFWIGIVVSVIGGISLIGSGAAGYGAYGMYGEIIATTRVLSGLLLLFLGPLVIRIYCELLILFFRMNETLTEIRNNTEQRSE